MGIPQIEIALIGISDVDRKRLEAIFANSHQRQIHFSLCELHSDLAQILIVNADEPKYLIDWRGYRNKLNNQNVEVPPSIVVSKRREFKTEHYQIKHPLIYSRVISVLDQVVTQILGIKEALVFEPEENDDSISISEETLEKKGDSNTDNLRRILIVDDSLPVRVQMRKALQNVEANLDIVESGEEAFEHINQHHYDLIFLDVVLPGVNGYEVCKVIKQSSAKDTPVIMLTGNSSSEDRIKGKLAGCDTYLIKPVKPLIFREVVSQYLRRMEPASNFA